MLPCPVSGLLLALQRAAPIQSAAWQFLWSNSNLAQRSQPEQQPQASPHISKCAWLHSVDSSAPADHNTDSSSNHSTSSMKISSKCGPCSSCTAQARAHSLNAFPSLQSLLLFTQHKQLHAPQHALACRAAQDSCLPSTSRGMAHIAAAGAEAGGTRARRSRRSVASPPASPAVDLGGNAGSASDSASATGSTAGSSSRRKSRTGSSARTAKQAGQAAAAGGVSPPGQTAQEAQQLLGQLQQYCEAYYAGRPLVSNTVQHAMVSIRGSIVPACLNAVYTKTQASGALLCCVEPPPDALLCPAQVLHCVVLHHKCCTGA